MQGGIANVDVTHGSGGSVYVGGGGGGGGSWLVQTTDAFQDWSGTCPADSIGGGQRALYGRGDLFGTPEDNWPVAWSNLQKAVYNNFLACAAGGGAGSVNAGANDHACKCGAGDVGCYGPRGGDGGGGYNFYGCGTGWCDPPASPQECTTSQGCGNFQGKGSGVNQGGVGIGDGSRNGQFFRGAASNKNREAGGGGWGGGGAGEYGAGGGAGNIRQGANWANPSDTGIYQNLQLGRARTTEPGWEQGGGNWNRVIPQWVRTAYGSQYNFGTRDSHGLVIISSEPIS